MKVLVLLCLVPLVFGADDDGRYTPDNSGQYVPSNEGQYIPDFSGLYSHDGTGGYKDEGSGRYAGDRSARFSGLTNLQSSSTRQKPVQVQPVEVKRDASSTPPPTPRLPQKTYENQKEGKWKIIRQVADIDTDGYHWEYETENRILAEESGKLHNVGTDAETMRAKGFYQYTGPDNVVYSVEYTADENGFFPSGKHMPTPPPLPEELVKAIARAENKL